MSGYVNIAHYRGVLVWTKEHGGSMVFSSHEDHEHMKTVSAQLFNAENISSEEY